MGYALQNIRHQDLTLSLPSVSSLCDKDLVRVTDEGSLQFLYGFLDFFYRLNKWISHERSELAASVRYVDLSTPTFCDIA
jgi:hypothetical protein